MHVCSVCTLCADPRAVALLAARGEAFCLVCLTSTTGEGLLPRSVPFLYAGWWYAWASPEDSSFPASPGASSHSPLPFLPCCGCPPHALGPFDGHALQG